MGTIPDENLLYDYNVRSDEFRVCLNFNGQTWPLLAPRHQLGYGEQDVLDAVQLELPPEQFLTGLRDAFTGAFTGKTTCPDGRMMVPFDFLNYGAHYELVFGRLGDGRTDSEECMLNAIAHRGGTTPRPRALYHPPTPGTHNDYYENEEGQGQNGQLYIAPHPYSPPHFFHPVIDYQAGLNTPTRQTGGGSGQGTPQGGGRDMSDNLSRLRRDLTTLLDGHKEVEEKLDNVLGGPFSGKGRRSRDRDGRDRTRSGRSHHRHHKGGHSPGHRSPSHREGQHRSGSRHRQGSKGRDGHHQTSRSGTHHRSGSRHSGSRHRHPSTSSSAPSPAGSHAATTPSSTPSPGDRGAGNFTDFRQPDFRGTGRGEGEHHQGQQRVVLRSPQQQQPQQPLSLPANTNGYFGDAAPGGVGGFAPMDNPPLQQPSFPMEGGGTVMNQPLSPQQPVLMNSDPMPLRPQLNQMRLVQMQNDPPLAPMQPDPQIQQPQWSNQGPVNVHSEFVVQPNPGTDGVWMGSDQQVGNGEMPILNPPITQLPGLPNGQMQEPVMNYVAPPIGVSPQPPEYQGGAQMEPAHPSAVASY